MRTGLRVWSVAMLVMVAFTVRSFGVDDITIMTWNVRGYPEKKIPRCAFFSDMLAQYTPDVLCIQEIGNLEHVEEFLMVEPGFDGVAFTNSSASKDNAIFFGAGVCFEDLPDPSGFQHPAEFASCAIDGFAMMVLTVHFTAGNAGQRLEERAALIEWIGQNSHNEPANFIIAGDFNTTGRAGNSIDELANSIGMQVVWQTPLVATTCAGHFYDFVLVSPSILADWDVSSTVIQPSDTDLAREVSDHFPVLLTLMPKWQGEP